MGEENLLMDTGERDMNDPSAPVDETKHSVGKLYLAKSSLKAVCWVVAVAWIGAYLGGLLWGVVDWLRTYGSAYTHHPFPYFDPSPVPVQPFRLAEPGTLASMVEEVNNAYNAAFRGATRFGSGIGLMVGALYAVAALPREPAFPRALAAFVAGAHIGWRALLMVASAPLSCLAAAAICACIAAMLSAGNSHAKRLPELPRITFEA